MAEDIIKARIVFDTSAMNSIAGAGGATVSTGSASVGSSGIVGAVSKGFAIANVALGGIKKAMEKIYQASPRLQASMSILNKSLLMILRPIGDVLSLFVRPLAIQLLRFAIPFYKKFQEIFKNLDKSGAGGIIGGIVGGAATGAATGAAIGSVVGPIGTGVGAAAGAMIGAVGGGAAGLATNSDKIWENVKKGAENLAQGIGGRLDNLFENWGIDMDVVRGKLATWIEDFKFWLTVSVPQWIDDVMIDLKEWWEVKLPAAIQTFGENVKTFIGETVPNWIIEKWVSIKTFFGVTVPDWIIKQWEHLKTFLSVTVPNWIIKKWDDLKEFLTVTVPNWFKDMKDKAIAWLKGLVDWIPFVNDKKDSKKSTKKGDFVVAGSKIIESDPMDIIMGVKSNRLNNATGSRPISVNININALDVQSFENSQVIKKIESAIESSLRRNLLARSTESIGVLV